MLLRDLINKTSGVMVYRLHLIDSEGAYVDADVIDYINQDPADCDLKIDTYGDWYVEEIVIESRTMIGVQICPIDREEAGL